MSGTVSEHVTYIHASLDTYGTVEANAEQIARFVLELEASGIANGLAAKVRELLEIAEANRVPGSDIPVVGGPPEIGTVADLFRGEQE